MVIKFITKSLDENLYIDDVPLSYTKYGNGSFIRIMMNENEIIGIARIYDKRNVMELADVYIYEKYQGQGYGNMLIENMINDVKENIVLWTTSDNIKAINLYKKYGFIERKMDKRMEKRLRAKYKWIKSKLIYFTKQV